jgi:hypothetical protein
MVQPGKKELGQMDKWTKKYNGTVESYKAKECSPGPGQHGYKTARRILTQLIPNLDNKPMTIADYTTTIKSVWDDQDTLSKTNKGENLQEFVMPTSSMWPMDIFLLDWDDNGFLHVSEDTKAWWAVQKLTGFHCHHFKAFHSANQRIKTELSIDAEAPANKMGIEAATPATTFNNSDDDEMETGNMKTSTDISSPAPPMPSPEILSDNWFICDMPMIPDEKERLLVWDKGRANGSWIWSSPEELPNGQPDWMQRPRRRNFLLSPGGGYFSKAASSGPMLLLRLKKWFFQEEDIVRVTTTVRLIAGSLSFGF